METKYYIQACEEVDFVIINQLVKVFVKGPVLRDPMFQTLVSV